MFRRSEAEMANAMSNPSLSATLNRILLVPMHYLLFGEFTKSNFEIMKYGFRHINIAAGF